MRSMWPVVLIIGIITAGCDTRANSSDANTPAATAAPAVPPPVPSHSLTAPPTAANSPVAAPADAAPATTHHAPPAATPSTMDAAPAVAAATADPSPAAPTFREITIPSGTSLSLQLGTTVASDTSSIEDPVNATLSKAVVIEGATVLPAGTAVSGYVTEAERSARVKGRARVGMRFNSIRVGDSRYSIRTASVTREAGATKKADATKIGVGAGAGAVVGAIAGGKKGAAIGTAVGAAGGTGVVLATRGEEVSLARGAVVTTRLSAPLTIRVRN